MQTLSAFGFSPAGGSGSAQSHAPVVNPPPPLREGVQLKALDLGKPVIRNLLRQLFFGALATDQAKTKVLELIRAYAAAQTKAVRDAIKAWKAYEINELRYALVFALEDMCGVQLDGETGSGRQDYKPADVLPNIFANNTPLGEYTCGKCVEYE